MQALERDAQLTDIQDKAETLRDGAEQFRTAATRLKRKMWYKNVKVPVHYGSTECRCSSLCCSQRLLRRMHRAAIAR